MLNADKMEMKGFGYEKSNPIIVYSFEGLKKYMEKLHSKDGVIIDKNIELLCIEDDGVLYSVNLYVVFPGKINELKLYNLYVKIKDKLYDENIPQDFVLRHRL